VSGICCLKIIKKTQKKTQMATPLYPYNRDISASLHVNANSRKYLFCEPTANSNKKLLHLFAIICVHLRSFAFSFSCAFSFQYK